MTKEIAKSSNTLSTVQDMLTKNIAQLKAALPKHITPDKMIRVALSEISKNNALKECSALSLCKCIIISSQIGLFPDSVRGEAFFVPFTNTKSRTKEAQLIIGYKGMMKLAYQSGQVLNINPREVYKNDVFDYSYGLRENLIHKPASSERGDVVYYYVTATLSNGGKVFDVMSREDVEKHMTKYAKAYNNPSSPWQTQFDAMGIKTVIRRLLKYLPNSSENLSMAIAIDERADLTTQNELSFGDDLVYENNGEDNKREELSRGNEILSKLESEQKNGNQDKDDPNYEFIKELN